MSDYVDKLVSGEQPSEAPELTPANDDARCEVSVAAPIIEGVPSSHEEKRFYDQAHAVVERESREGLVGDGPQVDDRTAWKRAERQASEALKFSLQAFDHHAMMLVSLLRQYEVGALGLDAIWITDPLGGAHESCTRVMAEIARISGRQQPYLAMLSNLDRIRSTAERKDA